MSARASGRPGEGGPRERRRHHLSRRRFSRAGHVLERMAALAILAMVAAWGLSVASASGREAGARRGTAPAAAPGEEPRLARSVASAVLDPRAKSTAYIEDAALSFLDPLRGESGKVRAAFRQPGAKVVKEVDPHLDAVYGEGELSPDFTAPQAPGVYELAVKLGEAKRAVEGMQVITLVPFEKKSGNKLGLYYIGSWPFEKGGTPRTPAYANPSGFIEVTPENRDTHVSEHFRLRDFVTKGQENVWPKYLVLEPRLLDKLELVIQELQAAGHDVRHVTVMSGFRTPSYNATGGNTGGRANLSRHMYGDAADVFVDNDRNGSMDDLNGDGRVDAKDAQVVGDAASRVEAKHPALVGGVGVYRACCGHGPFTHVDVRGYRARWMGEGNG